MTSLRVRYYVSHVITMLKLRQTRELLVTDEINANHKLTEKLDKLPYTTDSKIDFFTTYKERFRDRIFNQSALPLAVGRRNSILLEAAGSNREMLENWRWSWAFDLLYFSNICAAALLFVFLRRTWDMLTLQVWNYGNKRWQFSEKKIIAANNPAIESVA